MTLTGIPCDCDACRRDFAAESPAVYRIRWRAREQMRLYEPPMGSSVVAVSAEGALLVGQEHADRYASSALWQPEHV